VACTRLRVDFTPWRVLYTLRVVDSPTPRMLPLVSSSAVFHRYNQPHVVVLSPLVIFAGDWFSSTATLLPTPQRQMSMFYSLFLFVFFFFQAVKAIFTFGFVLTFISIFLLKWFHIWVCYCSYFFARLQFEFSNLSRFGAFLTPLSYIIRGVPHKIAFSCDHFSWSLYQG
jgi:hypothetical protein